MHGLSTRFAIDPLLESLSSGFDTPEQLRANINAMFEVTFTAHSFCFQRSAVFARFSTELPKEEENQLNGPSFQIPTPRP